MTGGAPIGGGEVVLPCHDLPPSLAFFQEELGFRLEGIFPADAPRTAVLSGHGLRLRLDPGVAAGPTELRFHGAAGEERELVAPNGTRIKILRADPPVAPGPFEPRLVHSRAVAGADFGVGRAGMRYRDLIPGRLGGRYIASHIRIEEGGPVPDWVHYHRVRFQMIHCVSGWVRVVYEDQGPPFVMAAGDGVLQPPGIRHRVLESSPGLEVVELGLPAEHETWADPELDLPTGERLPDRDFGGQRFVRYRAEGATWGEWEAPGFEARDSGIAAATDGLAKVRVVRAPAAVSAVPWNPTGELVFLYQLTGSAGLAIDGADPLGLEAGDALVVPPASTLRFEEATAGASFLEVQTRPMGADVGPA